jgi:hypothetical protein
MKSWTLIASYLWKDTWSRWLEQPSSVLSRVFVGSLLVTVATVILVAFHLLERNLRTRLEAFGVNTIVTREPVSHTDHEALPNIARPDRMHALAQHGEKLRLRQFYQRATTPWHRDLVTLSYAEDALPLLGPYLRSDTANICLSESLPENSIVPFNVGLRHDVAIVRRPEGFLKPLVNQQHVLLVPMGFAPENERIGYIETVVFRRNEESAGVAHFVAAIRNLFGMEGRAVPQIQSAIGMVKELESLQARQAQWRSAMAGMLGLAVALVFGAIAVLEFRQNSYVSALLRSFGAPGKALYIRQWIENAVLANLAAVSAILILACFHKELFGLLGFPRDLLNLNTANPYFSWEIALVLVWVNIGAFLSSLSVAIGLRKPVGEILS